MERATEPTTYVAIVCWLDLLGYGKQMNAARFDPAHRLAERPLSRLRAFHEVVRRHSGSGFPTLVMNDGAAVYRNVAPVRTGSIWRFVERCWQLYSDASETDLQFGRCGLRGVIAVGLRAKGSASGIQAQEDQIFGIIDELDRREINKKTAHERIQKVRRDFDIVPPLQANFAFARAYQAECEIKVDGERAPSLLLDTAVFREDIPSWIKAGEIIRWSPARPHLSALASNFVVLKGLQLVSDKEARLAFRTGNELRRTL